MKNFQINSKLSKEKFRIKRRLFLTIILICFALNLPAAAQSELPPGESESPTTTAGEISNRMIELIKSVKTKDDISSANVERVMKIKVRFDEKNRRSYGFSGRIEGTSRWSYYFSVYPHPGSNHKEPDTLNFSFNPLMDDEKTPRDDYAPVCAVDFDAYRKELKDAGYSSAPYYGEHGRLLWWNFLRGAVSVQITAYGESEKRADHQCVNMLTMSANDLAEPVIEKVEEPPPPPPPLPKPTLSLPKKPNAVETLVGEQLRQIRIRTLLLSLPSKMVSSQPIYGNLPEHLKQLKDFEIKTNGDAVWTDDIAIYEVLNSRKESLLKVEVAASLYNADFTKTVIDGKPAGETKEKLLELDYLDAVKAVEQSASSGKTVKYFTPNKLKSGQGTGQGRSDVERDFNVEGIYQMSDVAGRENRFVLTWHTYRLVDNKAQKLKITISGANSEISVAEKILNSAVFDKNTSAAMSSETFKTESIKKFGIENIGIPANMIAEPLQKDKGNYKDFEWTIYRYVWKTPVTDFNPDSSLNVEVTTTIYNADFNKVADDLPAGSRTPEIMILIGTTRNFKINKISGDNSVKESKITKLSGVDGTYALFRTNNGGFLASWQTYRLIDGKAQIISVAVKGDPGEILKAEQIIKSFTLSAK